MSENNCLNKAEEIIRAVTDEYSFIEMLTLVKGKSSLGETVGEGVVSGFASIGDIRVGIFANNSDCLLGSIGKKTAKKISKCIEDAIVMNIPVIGILDSSGSRFAEGIKAMEGYGGILSAMSKAYGKVPTIIVLKGNCYGMISYLSGCCDACIAFEDAKLCTVSPLILAAKSRAEISKVATANIHYTQSGLITQIVKDEKELRTLLTDILDRLTFRNAESNDDPNRICESLQAGSKAHEIIAQCVDNGNFIEFNGGFAKEVVVGLARIGGVTTGIIANNTLENNYLTSFGASKISKFLTTCANFSLPIVNIVDCLGAAIGTEQENNGLIREISDMIFCYNISSAAKVSVIVGNAVGLGYVAFASKKVFDYTVAWDSAYIGMLDSEATALLIYGDEIAAATDKQAATEELAKEYAEENCSALVVAESGYLDNVISPQLTRQYLIAGLMMYSEKE